MVNTRKLNIVSTIFALSIYIVVILFFANIVLKKYENIRIYGKDVNDTITIDLKELPISKENKMEKHGKKTSKLIKISEGKKSTKQDSRDIKKSDVKSLFSTMKVDKNANTVEEKLKQEKKRASRLKKIEAKELFKSTSLSNDKNIKTQLLKIKKILNSVKKSTPRGQYDDKYISKVSSIIMKLWQNTIGTQDGLKAYVTIKFDNNGNLTYKNLKPSFNELFDNKLKEFLKEITKMKFPPYKNRFGDKYIEVEFIFSDKEEI